MIARCGRFLFARHAGDLSRFFVEASHLERFLLRLVGDASRLYSLVSSGFVGSTEVVVLATLVGVCPSFSVCCPPLGWDADASRVGREIFFLDYGWLHHRWLNTHANWFVHGCFLWKHLFVWHVFKIQQVKNFWSLFGSNMLLTTVHTFGVLATRGLCILRLVYCLYPLEFLYCLTW